MKNKELDVQMVRLEQSPEANAFVEVPEKLKTLYSDLIVQLAKTPRENGVGDLEEQMVRMDIIKKAKVTAKGKQFNFSRQEIDILKSLLSVWKIRIIDEGLIGFQKEVKELSIDESKS